MHTITIFVPLDAYAESKDTFSQGNPIIDKTLGTIGLTYDLAQFEKYADQFNQPYVNIEELVTVYQRTTKFGGLFGILSEIEKEFCIKYNSVPLIKFLIDKIPEDKSMIDWLKHAVPYPDIWSFLCKLEFGNGSWFEASFYLTIFDFGDNDMYLEQFITFFDTITINNFPIQQPEDCDPIIDFLGKCSHRSNYKIAKYFLTQLSGSNQTHCLNIESEIMNCIVWQRLDFVDMFIEFHKKMYPTFQPNRQSAHYLCKTPIFYHDMTLKSLNYLHDIVILDKYDSVLLSDDCKVIQELILTAVANDLTKQFVYLVTAFPWNALLSAVDIRNRYLAKPNIKFYLEMIEEMTVDFD